MNTINGTLGNDFLIGIIDLPFDIGEVFYGFDGNDTILGLGTNDILNGGNDQDSLNGGAGNDIHFGDAGDDTILGGDGADTLFGGVGADVLYGDAGDDVLYGDEGIDTLFGGLGNDSLFGGLDDDLLYGGAGNDVLDGGTGGQDFAFYTDAPGAVTLSLALQGLFQNTGSAGTDLLREIENLVGSNFNDVLLGNAAANVLAGQAGNDFISGAAGNDSQLGDEGDDTLEGGAGNDILLGGIGLNTVTYATAAASVTVSLALQASIQYTGIATDFDVLQDFQNLIGSSFNDVLTGDGFANVIDGGLGNDSIDAGDGNDTLQGSKGSDTLRGALGQDWVDYSAFPDAITLATFGQVNKGVYGIDTLENIEFIVASASSRLDTLDLSGAVAPANGSTANLLSGRVSVSGVGLPFPINFTVQNFENISGTNFADIIIGNEQSNRLLANRGDDTIRGGLGNDTIDGGAGIDWVSYQDASAGVAISLAAQGSAQNTGVTGADLLLAIENVQASNYDDNLVGDGNNNVILAELGNDYIAASGGNDTLDGGLGLDTVDYSQLGTAVRLASQGLLFKRVGFDQLVGVEIIVATAGGGDTIDHSGAGAPATGTITNLSTGQVTVNGVGSPPFPLNFTVKGFEDVIGSIFADNIIGNAGANILQGGLGDDIIIGADGMDTASYASATAGVSVSLALQGVFQSTGVTGNDFLSQMEDLLGSAFNDRLTGDALNNVIDGGPGNDSLQGGAGVDTASYLSAQAPVTVSLALQGILQNTGASGVDLLQGFENLTGSHFNDSLTGDTLNNTIAGGLGNDTMLGGNGNDTASYADAPTGVTVGLNLQGAAQNTVAGGVDLLQGFENLIGSRFNDLLTSDAVNKNILTGGSGNDVFRFLSVSQSPFGALRDVITDFEVVRDKVDLRSIDANSTTPLNDAFIWIGANGVFTAAGQLRYVLQGSSLLLQANTDALFTTIDLEIQLNNLTALASSDVFL